MVKCIITNKKILVVLSLLLCSNFYCQTSGIGIGTSVPKALLEVYSDDVANGGVLIPRYTVDDVSTLNLGPEHDSMLFYIKASPTGVMQGTGIATNVNSPGYYFYEHSSNILLKLSSSKDSSYNWSLIGNNDVNAAHFIGTVDNFPLKFKVNNTFSGFIGKENVALGYNSLNNLIASADSGTNNVAFGVNSIQNLTSGSDNIGIGFNALATGTVIEDNVALGNGTLASLTDGTDNIAIGKSVLNLMTSGRYNVGIGGRVMQEASGATRQNVAIGYRVLNKVNVVDAYNIGIGYAVLEKGENVKDNVVIGRSAAPVLTTGDRNVALGREAIESLTEGNDNVVMGHRSLEALNRGNSNVALGTGAMQIATTASENIAIGYRSATNFLSGTNNIIIGNLNQTSSPNISNEVTLGNQLITSYRMWTSGWATLSDRSTKDNILPLTTGLEFVKALKPSEFVYKKDVSGKKSFGFIAQDIQDLLSKNGITGTGLIQNFEDGYIGLRMNDLIPILTKAIQDQDKIITEQQAEIDKLKSDILAIKAALNIK